MNNNRSICAGSAFVSLILLASPARTADQDAKENRWEATIRKFEEQDKAAPPSKGGVLFIGSSSIRNWDLKNSFPNEDFINRGFGGSEIADSTLFAERIALPYEPRVIVMYAGDNDIAREKTPEQVAADFHGFVKTIHESAPKTKIVFIAIKPSIARWSLVEKMREANEIIQQIICNNSNLVFVDIDKPMLGDDGKPRKELFAEDGLHLSGTGYELWTSLVKPHVAE